MDPIVESVILKLRGRSAVGLKKYGVGLDRTDLSTLDWLTHAQNEALDTANYLERLIRDERARLWDRRVEVHPVQSPYQDWYAPTDSTTQDSTTASGASAEAPNVDTYTSVRRAANQMFNELRVIQEQTVGETQRLRQAQEGIVDRQNRQQEAHEALLDRQNHQATWLEDLHSQHTVTRTAMNLLLAELHGPTGASLSGSTLDPVTPSPGSSALIVTRSRLASVTASLEESVARLEQQASEAGFSTTLEQPLFLLRTAASMLHSTLSSIPKLLHAERVLKAGKSGLRTGPVPDDDI